MIRLLQSTLEETTLEMEMLAKCFQGLLDEDTFVLLSAVVGKDTRSITYHNPFWQPSGFTVNKVIRFFCR